MNDIQVPVWEKYAMTVEEASQYFSVGQNKIRQLAQQDRFIGYSLYKQSNF